MRGASTQYYRKVPSISNENQQEFSLDSRTFYIVFQMKKGKEMSKFQE